MQDTFDEIVANSYASPKTDEEFNLGLALGALLDYLAEPEEWTPEMLNGVFAHAEIVNDIWQQKYDAEIRSMNEQN